MLTKGNEKADSMQLPKLLALILLLVVAGSPAAAGAENADYELVVGSPHDLTVNPAINGPDSACAYCHLVDEDTGEALGELNRNKPVSEIKPYASARLSTETSGLGEITSHCMSCHDGETPLDAIGGDPGTENGNMNTLFPGSTAIIGTDLGIHHPVGVTNPVGIYFNDPSAIARSGLPLFDDRVECLTCHDVHGTSGIEKFMAKDNEGSSLCLDCHNK